MTRPLMLRAIAGPDPRAPISIAEPAEKFAAPLERDFAGVRVALSSDLGGLPVDPQVREVFARQRETLDGMGCEVHDAEPDFTDADEIFKVWRAWMFELKYADLLASHRDQIKETVVWNVEQGSKLTGPQICRENTKGGIWRSPNRSATWRSIEQAAPARS